MGKKGKRQDDFSKYEISVVLLKNMHTNLELADLIQDGSMGLMKGSWTDFKLKEVLSFPLTQLGGLDKPFHVQFLIHLER